MPEYRVRIHQPVVTTMKVIRYTVMTIRDILDRSAGCGHKRLVKATLPQWDGFVCRGDDVIHPQCGGVGLQPWL